MEPTCTKIYYTSRTHSQLSQVLHELQKLKIQLSPPSVTSLRSGESIDITYEKGIGMKRSFPETGGQEDEDHVDIRSVSLGSRKQLCVNEKLKAKASDLDEACRQMLGG